MTPLDPGPVFLVGFMATGKSTVGRQVAERLGRRSVDLDDEVERRTGKRVHEIFRDGGESAFRAAEAAALAEVAGWPDVVVACGGGTPCHGDNLQRMRAAGVVIALRASLDEIVRRVGDTSSRPLLDGEEGARAAAERLYRARESIYAASDLSVDTDGRSPEQVAAEVTEGARLRLGAIAVRLGERSYPIHLAPLVEAGRLVPALTGAETVAVVTDRNVERAGHAGTVVAALAARGLGVTTLVVEPGERSKRLAEVERLAGECVAAGLERRSAIVAVGGGVVGDLAGLLAALLYRGVACVQVPTTLLAMVDASIGGKTAVDLPAGKNLVGAFWQPRLVLADLGTLATLPRREYTAAFGEIVKVGLSGEPSLLAAVTERGRDIDLADAVLGCARFKARIVAADEREEGHLRGAGPGRAVLNLGHTVGHAIEAASGYAEGGGLLHGEAVALGLVAAARVSAGLGLCDRSLEEQVILALGRAGLPADLSPWLGDEVLGFLPADKKRAGAKVHFVALEGAGRPRIVDLSPSEITRLLREARG